jgi:hypothetical protein
MRTLLLAIALAFCLCAAVRSLEPAQATKPAVPAAAPAAAFDHSAFDALLKKHVKGDRVDYKALQADRAALDGYCERLAKLAKADLEAMARNDQFAFWIDAYNALTLATIVDHYPIKEGPSPAKPSEFPKNSIRQIDGAWTTKHTVASQQLSLDEIENKVLRPGFKDPRVHTAINCASRGCPPLRAEAFTGAKLEAQLNDNVERFLADPARTVYDAKGSKLVVSKIFDWFKEDFGGDEGVLKFIRAHAPAGQKGFLEKLGARSVAFADYDWTLNDV